MTYESKYAVGDVVSYRDPDTKRVHVGMIEQVSFTASEVIYNCQTYMPIYEKNILQKFVAVK